VDEEAHKAIYLQIYSGSVFGQNAQYLTTVLRANVLLEKLKEQRFFDLVVGKGNTEIPPSWLNNPNLEG